MNYDIIEATSFEEVLSEIEENSKYKRLPPKEKNWMTVPEMGNLLGLKKTGRYWLVQKNYFECREIAGQMRVNIASFEKWYANQVKYHKVNGEEPGKNLKKWSYSISEVAKMLGISETTVYDLIRRDGIKTVTVDYWIRIPKKSFQEWYEKQSKYRTQKDREKDKELEGATITMPEMARLLGIPRRQVYEILKNSKYSHFFETIEIAEKKRITKESFQKFLDGQDHYKLDPANDYEELSMLVEWKAEQDEVKEVLGEEYIDYNLVMATTFGNPIGTGAIRGQLKKLIEEHNLPPVVFHSLRHSSVTYKLKLNGGDIKAVQGDSGHSQVDMVTDVYSHIIDEDRRRNAELFEEAFYEKKNLDPKMREETTTQTVDVPDDVDAELLAKVLANPEMKALLASLAKAMK